MHHDRRRAQEHAYHADPLYYEGRADGLLASATDGTPGAVAAFERAGAPLTAAGARAVVAAEHGYDGWADLLEHVAALASSDDPFLVAYRAVEAHDVEALAAALDAAPDVVREVGTNGNDLLGMAAYTCDERTVGLLLERGADVAHAQRPRLDGAAPGRVRRAGAADAAAARRGGAGRGWRRAGRAGRRSSSRCSGARRGPPSCWRRGRSRRATCASPPGSATSRCSPSCSRRRALRRRPRAPRAGSTARTAASRPGRRAPTPPRSSTRR